jgi:hypothetical protein
MDTFRRVYTSLTDGQKAEMETIKVKAEELEALFNRALPRNPRLIAMAKSELEISVLLGVKAVTTAEPGLTGSATTLAKAE